MNQLMFIVITDEWGDEYDYVNHSIEAAWARHDRKHPDRKVKSIRVEGEYNAI